jgi:leader peptidase (prepilin peptidase)/N-methyltransferase
MWPIVLIGGLIIGSFLNVVIVRLPRGGSLWRPRSACPACGAAIAWHDNVPVLSFVLLRGRCRACAAPIAWRYPAVELATAGLFGLAYGRFGHGPDLAVALVLLSALVVITGIDLEHQIIPDVISLPGIALGLAGALWTGTPHWTSAALGVLVGGGVFWVILQASLVITGREGMGGGDIKLGAMLGAFLGWQVVLLSIFLAVVLGGALAIALLATGVTGRKDAIPFGPFLAAGGVIGLLWGPRVITWYVSAFGG